MLDIRLIRSEPDVVRASLARRDPAAAETVDIVLELDERWRGLTTELEQVRSEQNAASKALRGAPSTEQREQLAALAARGRGLSDAETQLRAERDEAMRSLPNLPLQDAPAQDTVLRQVGDATKTGRDHLELAGWRIDMERGARLSGSRFAYLRGELVLVELALVTYAMRKLVAEGFEPVIPPVLVREQALYGTGYFPDSRSTTCQTTICTWSAPLRSPSRRCTPTRSSSSRCCRCATPASPAASGVRPAPPARTREGSFACTSSTRSRCSRSASPTRLGTSTSDCWRSRSRS
jgi:seryl-tRNA synthetase